MKEQLINFETAKLAKEKGFKWKSRYGYLENGEIGVSHYSTFCENDDEDFPTKYSAPTQSLLQRWLREQHEIIVTVYPFHMSSICEDLDEDEFKYECLYSFTVHKRTKFKKDGTDYSTYEEALEEGLLNALKLIENGSRD